MDDGWTLPDEPDAGAAPRLVAVRQLRDWALRYLARYAASRATVRRVLLRKAARRELGVEAAQMEAVLDDLERLGLLDDATFAQARARTLQARGRSLQRIRTELARKGIERPAAEAAVEALGDEAELQALKAFARRRRVGPWRRGEPDLVRELTILARAGFAMGLARRLVEADAEDELDQP